MPKGLFIALANAADGAPEDDFNQWYDDVHAKEVLALPGVRSCTRYKLADPQLMDGDDAMGFRYLAAYEVEVDDWADFRSAMLAAFGDGRVTVDGQLLQMDPMPKTMLFEEVTPRVEA
ncbi:MAG TPA: EthD domain-containing protein [Acidimicrobiia bacterium]|nr:EthD domain-containing protein [Acidimicrobiia bacterium]